MSHDLVVFGEALVDRFVDRSVVGGAPFNVARHLAGLGFAPLMVTRIGSDVDGAAVIDAFDRFALSTAGLQVDPGRPTGAVVVHEREIGDHVFEILPDAAYDFIDPGPTILDCLHQRPKPMYCGTLAQRSPKSRASLVALRAVADSTFLDLNLRDVAFPAGALLGTIQAVDTLKVNEAEWHTVRAWYGLPAADIPERIACGDGFVAAAALMAITCIGRLIVTTGARGAAAFDRDGTCIAATVGHPTPDLVDTVGAGDAFAAVALAGGLAGWSIEVTLDRAAQFAADICRLRGAVPEAMAHYAPWRATWGLPTHAGTSASPAP